MSSLIIYELDTANQALRVKKIRNKWLGQAEEDQVEEGCNEWLGQAEEDQ